MLGESPELKSALDRLALLAPSDLAILIQGETGTGKELAARRIHRLSPRAQLPFLAVNCAALPESLLLSDLFGHVKGSFTGADRDRAGIFEASRGGTVFLDEIGDLPLPAQGKLLRVLQEREVRRLGESVPRRVEVRIVAATHRNLSSMVRDGEFRRDLFYRLKVGSVVLPPLRQRGGDVLLLGEYFVVREGYQLSSDARRRLRSYPWPGNVRELRNTLEVAKALSDDYVIRPEHLELPESESGSVVGYHQQVREFRRDLVREALRASGGNRSEAARNLGLSRQALSYLVRSLAIP
jgi:transcriptional regulator with PAS, ATPase and Fis domain